MSWCADVSWRDPRPPESAVWDRGKRVGVVFHGALLNRSELLQRFELERDTSDAQLAAESLARWGEPGLTRLAGGFSLAAWVPSRGEFLAAADAVGIESLVLSERGERLGVATGTRALRALSWVGDDVDETAVGRFLNRRTPDPEATFYRAIRRLRSGYLLKASSAGVTSRRYWGPPFAPDPSIRNTNDLLDRFRELFLQVVGESLSLHPRSAILMSGGFDSTAVAGAAARLPIPQHPVLLSSTFPGLPCDESSRIDLARRSLPLDSVVVPAVGGALDIDRALQSARDHDQPGLNLQQELFETYAAQAHATGARSVVSGLGGDELCIDWHYEVDFVRAAGLAGFAAAIGRIAGIEGISRLDALRLIAGRLRGRLRGPRQQYPWSSHSAQIRWQVLQDPRSSEARRWWVEELRAHGLALQSPFLDRRLWELVMGADRLLPRSFHAGQYKPLIAEGLRGVIPSELSRAYWKVSFKEYERTVLRRSLPKLCDLLFDPGLWASEQFVPRCSAQRMAMATRQDPPDPIALDTLPRVVALELWLRKSRSVGRSDEGQSQRA